MSSLWGMLANRSQYEEEMEKLGFSSVSEEMYEEAKGFSESNWENEDPPNVERTLTVNGEEKIIVVQFSCDRDDECEFMPYRLRFDGCRVY
ncbi:hypothetical protein BV454_00523 [Bacillus altitudinis]|uniref:hypothetical protein n=1 Tax=Bacillus TaxID=1386 RepID=UPI001CD66AB9|nr:MULTISPECIES: hypothetical protein [Bacillus]MCL4097205.1 hypothetical protein [Bacillus altitudinis]